MKVLVACEFSGVVRDAFLAAGHDAMSCDLRETEAPGPHYTGDVRDVLGAEWDMVIAHPPCDYLANCGVRWRVERNEWAEIAEGVELFKLFIDCAPLWAIENPVMARKYTHLPKPTFSRQPWQFGDNVKKRVCWWTNLPPLQPTSNLDGFTARADVHLEPPGPDRKKNRARFFPGMAKAMAEQWPVSSTQIMNFTTGKSDQ